MEDNKLMVIVEESGLETTKAQVLLERFSGYFKIAAEWEKKAKAIQVTDASQVVDMKMARTGRLFLRDKRIAIEKARKELKEQSLREGKAIDGIANVLKAVITPIELYLEKQEKFNEIKAAEKAEQLRVEAEEKAEAERIAKEKAEREEQERIRKENARLQKEAEAREKARIAYEKKVQAEKEEAERKASEEREAIERKARAEQERQERIIAQQKAKVEAERKQREAKRIAYEKKVQAEKADAEWKAKTEREAIERKAEAEQGRRDKEIAEQKAKAEAEARKAQALRERLAAMVTCPYCGKSFSPEEAKHAKA